ncbi:MAG: lytic transglycosylase domain-containing protein [Bryobacteraceae bacterium]
MKHFAALLFCLPLPAADLVTLASGAQISADRAECRAGACTLHIDGGRIELPASAIAAIEKLPEPERPAPPPPPPAPQPSESDPRTLVTEAALRHGLPPEIVHAVAAVESGYQPHAVSPRGALGVMQLMPATAAQLGADPLDLRQNIEAGARLLRELFLKYQNTPNPVRRALAAYNAGAGAVDRYNGVPPYRETRSYVERVIERYWRLASSPKPAQ